jgi:hypothetical protein
MTIRCFVVRAVMKRDLVERVMIETDARAILKFAVTAREATAGCRFIARLNIPELCYVTGLNLYPAGPSHDDKRAGRD